jgi:S1-C subfamily serine protease
MPAILAALFRFIALLVGVLFAAVGLDSPVEHWTNEEIVEQNYQEAQAEFDAIIGSSATIGTSTVLEAIVRAADGPQATTTIAEQILIPFVATTSKPATTEKPKPVAKPTAPTPTPSKPVAVVPTKPIVVAPTKPTPITPTIPTTTTPTPAQTTPATTPVAPATPKPAATSTKPLQLSDIIPTAPKSTPESAVVRISCVKESGKSMELQSGSGVFVSSKGYILTNSHVAFPISEGTYDCIVTEASNPSVGYEPEVVYISKAWTDDFAAEMRRGVLPAHTGENDIAILRAKRSINPAIPLPKSFPHIKTSSAEPSVGDRIKTWGYPAARTGSLIDDLANPIVSGSAKIAALYSFASGGIDVIETTKTATARQGSSGGAILSSNGELVGLTAAVLERNGDSVITGLTMSYIRSHLTSDGVDPDDYLK